MAGVKISALPAIASCALTDIVPEVQPATAGVTYKATLQQIYNLFTASSGTVNAGLQNQIAYYAANGSVISGLVTANSGALVTSAGGVPSISQTLPAAVQGNITTLGAQAAALNMNTHLINNVVDPISDQDAATKKYVDDTSQGRIFKDPVQAASLTSLTVTYANGAAGVGATLTNAGVQAAFAIDGYTAALNDRILIKDQSSTFQNGIYTVTTVGSGATNWVLTRALDMDTPSQFQYATTLILNGTQNGQTWTETLVVVTIGTDPVVFILTGDATGVTSVASGTGLTGGPITTTGTLSFAPIAAHSLWANVTSGSAVPTVIGTNTFIQQVVNQIITSTGTYTPTTGMLYCIVEITGSGGGSGGAAGTAGQFGASGGGGGGGYCRKLYTAAQIGATAAVVIGAAGAAGASGNNAGTQGNAGTFTPTGAGAVLTANGGQPGSGSPSSATFAFASGGVGGTATGGDINITGGYGMAAMVANGATGIGIPGNGGNSYFSNVPTNPTGGATGVTLLYGAGGAGVGSGGAANVPGANGSTGVCVITEFCGV